MNTREIEAKARLLFDEYGRDALALAERRSETFGRRSGPEAESWRAVHRRVGELTRKETVAEAAEIESEIMRGSQGSRLGRLATHLFGSARKPA